MKTITNNSITVKVQASVSATIALLKAAGAKIGKTSAADVLSGRKEMACGFFLAEEVEAPASTSSKMELAQGIFNEHFGIAAPKAVKSMFIEQAGLSDRGANTYYYKMKKAAESK